MSFILDALKKSEHERQRQTIPGLVESSVARPKSRLPTWAIAVCVLLAINLLVLSFVLMHGRAAQSRAQSDEPSRIKADLPATRAARDDASSSEDRPFSPLDSSAVYAPEIPIPATAAGVPTAAGIPAAAAVPSTAAAPMTRAPAMPGNSGERAARRRDPLLTDDDYKPNEDEVLPSINELNLTGAQALPELHLDVHVFATRAADRFVFINMRKYHEGATMQEGPTIERIRRDGVILDYQGVRFLLPRQ